MATFTRAATNENRKGAFDNEKEHSAEDDDSPSPAAPAPEGREQASSITGGPKGNGNSKITTTPSCELGSSAEAESKLDSAALCRPRPRPRQASPHLPPECTDTGDEQASKTKHEKKTPADAPRQHVGPTCSEGQRTAALATNVACALSTTTNAGNMSASNSVLELELSCKTGNTDSETPAVAHRYATLPLRPIYDVKLKVLVT